MGPDHWQRLQTLFCEAADLEADRQAALLASACADDPDLRSEIDALLEADAAGVADARFRAAIAAAAAKLPALPDQTPG
jgi:hypothetical protein